jgi:hypothetical protein
MWKLWIMMACGVATGCAGVFGALQTPTVPAPVAAVPAVSRPTDATIAASYPGDVGIEKDPDVIFAEGFEGEALPQAAWEKPGGFYDLKAYPALMRFTDKEAAMGARSLELVHPKDAISPQWMHRRFEGTDTVYVRLYRKFEKDWEWAPMGCHDTFLFAGEYVRPTSTDLTLYFDITGVNQSLPARVSVADAVLNKQPVSILRSALQGAKEKSTLDFGLGKAIGTGEDFKWYYWLPFNTSAAPVLEGGRWYCFEQMAKMNSAPGAKDGEVRMWTDGVLVTEMTGLTLRDEAHKAIQWNHWMLGPRYGGRDFKGGPSKELKSWIDGVIVAKRRVGMAKKKDESR